LTDFIQQCVNALALGGTYALLALGLAIVFSILGMINFAHGELMTIAGYTVFFVLAAGLPFPVGVVAAVLMGAAAGALMERTAFRPVRGASGTTLLITSFAVSLLLQVLFQNLISARPRPIAVPAWLDGTVSLGAVNVGRVQLVSMIAVLAAVLALTLLLRRTTMGIAMRAAATDFAVTRLMGIRANAVVSTAFALSGLFAGLAGVLWVAQRGSVDPLMGFLPVLKAFIAAVIGGLGSLSGAAIGGFLLGATEVFLQAYLPVGAQPYRDALVLLIVIAVLMFRPNGLFSQVAQVKV
jgi:branched-chain amino acid transport system permease protein